MLCKYLHDLSLLGEMQAAFSFASVLHSACISNIKAGHVAPIFFDHFSVKFENCKEKIKVLLWVLGLAKT